MKINALVIDDESKIVELIKMLLEENCKDVEVIGTATSYYDGIKAVDELKPDLIFLDIEMPHGNGFQLLENVTYKDFEVVFITAYNQYAIKAFKANAIDYILKPVSELDLIESVKRIAEIKENSQDIIIISSSSSSSSSSSKIEEILQIFEPKKISKIPLSTVNKIEFVDVDDIIIIEGGGSYSTVHTINDSITVSKTIKSLEDQIDNKRFFRSHKSYLINLDHVRAYYKNDGGLIEMSNNIKVPLSRNNKDNFLAWMDKFLKV